jgi:hypothetical protein
MTELVCFLLMDLTVLLNRLPRVELTVYNLNQMLHSSPIDCSAGGNNTEAMFLLKKGNAVSFS